MSEIEIKCDPESPCNERKDVTISVESTSGRELLYKYAIIFNGTWKIIKDFTRDKFAKWVPNEDGKYIVMVQAKKADSKKAFDYRSNLNYIVGDIGEHLIKNVYINKDKLNIGEKVSITAEASIEPSMFRFKSREDGGNWSLVRDYSPEGNLTFTAKTSGTHEMLVECKSADSEDDVDDSRKINFEVGSIKKVEIQKFESINPDMLIGEELVFTVKALYEKGRTVLYKFIKINPDASIECIQDYSTRCSVNYAEKKIGKYKILCMVKDMYSVNEYDDRAIINFYVKPYDTVIIRKLIANLSSPQICGTNILLRADAFGGKNLLYRFIIDGNYGEDSGYIKENTYLWETKKSGIYKVILWVRDSSSTLNYEDSKEIEFTVDKLNVEPVKINEVILSKEKRLIRNETVNVKVIASGGMNLRYGFTIKKDEKVIEKIEYGTCNWMNFTPCDIGNYEMEITVKDKYSEREFDSHEVIFFEVYDYTPANIDYILYPIRDYYIVGESVFINVITQNTKEVMVKYILKINGHKIEETDFVQYLKYKFVPKCSGMYEIEVAAKNRESKNEFDCKKKVNIAVHDALPVTNTVIKCDKTEIMCNDTVTFSVTNEGGREVVYEFYIMEDGEWKQVQKYSRKNYYSFISFASGNYKILVLCKSMYSKCFYEDYNILEFYVK